MGTERGHWIRPSSTTMSRRLGDEIVLVHLGTDRILSLNATAARFWELLEDGCDRTTITRTLLAEFDVDEAILDVEVDQLIERLRRLELVTTANDG